MTEQQLIEGIGDKTVRSVARRLIDSGAECAPLAEQVLRATESISARVDRAVTTLEQVPGLEHARLTAEPSGQLHQMSGALASWADAEPVVRQLRSDGWVTWHDLDGNAELALYRSTSGMTLAHLEDDPLVIDLTWPPGPLATLPAAVRPSVSDVSVVDLPAPLWPLYLAVRPLRLIAEKTGRREPRSRPLGPILSTPKQLIPELLELAGVTADDHLVDLGCGEGRVVVEAARTMGCRVTGVETDLRLVERAQRNVADTLGASSRATIVHGDAQRFDLADATVVFLFVPASAVGSIVDTIRAKGFAGAIVSHEQAALPKGQTPKSSKVLAVDGALTVAHLW